MFLEKYTLGECRERILKLLERYSSNGKENVCGEVLDIENRLVVSLDIHIRKLWYEFFDERKQCEFSFFRPKRRSDLGSFTVSEGGDRAVSSSGNKLGFYMVAGGKGRLLHYTSSEDSRVYIIDTDPGSYTVVCGAVDNPDGSDCIFTFSGIPCLDVKTFLIYEDVEALLGMGELLCDKTEASAYLPSDCSRLLSVRRKSDGGDIYDSCSVDRERGIVTIPYDMAKGEFIAEYIPSPELFGNNAVMTTAVTMSPVFMDALCYMCAADLCPANDPELYSKLTYKYREILENIYDRHREQRLKNIFYGNIRKRNGISVKTVK